MRSALVVSLILAIVAVIFATYNGGEMEVVIPLADKVIIAQKPIVLIATLLMGVVIGLLASLPGRIAATLRARRAEKEVLALRSGGAPAATPIVTDPSVAAAQARSAASDARAASSSANTDAAETQRLADEVARRTASIEDASRNTP